MVDTNLDTNLTTNLDTNLHATMGNTGSVDYLVSEQLIFLFKLKCVENRTLINLAVSGKSEVNLSFDIIAAEND